MLYSGVDLVEVARIERAVSRWGARFLTRVFTPAEQALCARRAESLAARWAAKEAVAKLLGSGLRGLGAGAPGAVSWGEIEVLADERGRPLVSLSGSARDRAAQLGIGAISLSLAHERGMALAFAVAMGEAP